MQRFFITDVNQLRPGVDLLVAMKAAEQLSGASSPGGSGPTTYVDEDGDPLQGIVIEAANGKVALLPPSADPDGLAPATTIQMLTTSNDLRSIPGLIAAILAGGDMAANAASNIGDIQFEADASILEKLTEAEQAQSQQGS
jgi:hypothetical protein